MASTESDTLRAQAAAAGFQVGDYVHMKTRSHTTAAPITAFSDERGAVVAHWQYGGCVTALGELRVSTGHRRLDQFPQQAPYAFYGEPGRMAEHLNRAGCYLGAECFAGVLVVTVGGGPVQVWATTEPRPTHPAAIYMRVDGLTAQLFEAKEAAAAACGLQSYAGIRYDPEWEGSFPEMVGDLLISLLHHAAALGEPLNLVQLTEQAQRRFAAQQGNRVPAACAPSQAEQYTP